MLRVLRKSWQNVQGSRGAGRTWTGKSRTVPLLLHIWIICMHLWASLYTLIKLNGTSITFVLVLFLRKWLSCLFARAAYHTSGNASEVGRRFAHGRFANTQLSRTCTLTPPSNRLSFMTRGSRRKTQLSRRWFRLMFCWGSLPVMPPLPRHLQRLAATNCLKFLTA